MRRSFDYQGELIVSKKPTSIPKIPKTRKKKAHTALSAIPTKPDKIEYLCKAFYKYDDVARKQYSVFAVETLVEFTSFAYEVSVDITMRRMLSILS